jgi:hypothetical protein
MGFAMGLIFLMCGPLSAKPCIIFGIDMDPDKLDAVPSRPHIARQVKNLVPNPVAKAASTWSLIGNAFSLTLPGINVGSGTKVPRIVPSLTEGRDYGSG